MVRIFNADFFILPHFKDNSWIDYPELLDSVELYKDVKLDSKAPLILPDDPIV